MLDDAAKNTLVPLVLRLALGVVFLYHGWGKVSDPANEWGASWAVNRWERLSRAPEEMLDRIDDLKAEERRLRLSEEQAEMVKQHVRVGYQQRRATPETLRFHAVQLAVAWGELAGGFALLFGLLTRLAALGMLVVQVGAIYFVTAERGFAFARGGGYEFNLALVAMCLALILLGGGTLAVDYLLSGRRRAATTKEAYAPAA